MKLALSATVALLAISTAHADEWSYEGAHGPDHWGGVCTSGEQQSPIDIHDVAHDGGAMMPDLHWGQGSDLHAINNGHTAQVNTPEGSYLTLEGVRYNLIQFHFHHMSEHTVEGHAYPLEVHFVHAAEDGNLAVVGVFYEEGEENAELAQIWSALPASEGEAAIEGGLDYNHFLPEDHNGYRYQGSLTTPPCSEIVSWTVLAEPLEASSAQIEAFASIFDNNARPVQDLHGRTVHESE